MLLSNFNLKAGLCLDHCSRVPYKIDGYALKKKYAGKIHLPATRTSTGKLSMIYKAL